MRFAALGEHDSASGHGSASGRGAWWRWLAIPWSSPVLVAAMATAAAAPVFLLVVAAGWQSAAEDQIASRVAATADLRVNGVDVWMEAQFEGAAVAKADELVEQRFAAIDRLEPPTFTLYTLLGKVSSPLLDRAIGTPVRLLAQDGALDSVTVVEQSDQPRSGIWVSRWFAEQFELGIGDPLLFEAGFVGDVAFNDVIPGQGTVEASVVTAIYEELWDEEGSPVGGFWGDVPPELLPRYVGPLGGPSTTLMLVDPVVLADSEVTGVVRWRSAANSTPDTLDGLQSLQSQYRRFETALVADGPLADAMLSLSTTAGRRPQFVTEFYETASRAEQAARRIGDPMRSGLTLGLVLSLSVLVAVGFFVVEQRRSEFRLLASDGDRWFRLGARVAAQSVAPAAIGVGAAVLVGATVVRWFGPAGRWSIDGLPWPSVLATFALAVVGTALVAGLVGQSTVTGPGAAAGTVSRTAGYLAFAGLAITLALLWIQAGERQSGVDTASLALPVVAFLLATSLFDGGLRLLLRVARAPSARDRPGLLLAWRRIAQGARPLRLATMAIGVGFGLVVTSVALVATFDRNLDAKLATQVAGTTRWTVFGTVPDDFALPPRTTWLFNQDTVVSPGGRTTRVVAVDEATFRSALSWHDEFGIDIDEAAELLQADLSGALPAIAIAGEGVPSEGGFGSTQSFPFQVVRRIDSLPLAGEFGATLLVSADRLDALGAARHELLLSGELERRAAELRAEQAKAELAGEVFDQEAHEAALPTLPRFIPPTDRYRRQLVSALTDSELEAAVEPGLSIRDRFSTTGSRADPNLVATRFAYEYVRVVGAVAVAVALAAMALYLVSRRRAAAMSSLMSRSMGIAANRMVASTVIEIAIVVAVGLFGAALAAPPVIRRLASRFDPLPRIPPGVDPVLGWSTIAGLGLLLVLLAAVFAMLIEWRDARRPAHEAVRSVQ